ncbi:MAG: Ribosomal protein L11 methyltransferase [Candidatus Omnitrophica bacterium ADurb.Bin292]|nr:MAG: Ribosomal protein L11 methyltransferase [Candidatus Omnitrophica bacterium ADurb.Bin292]HQB11586.1 50S ribosomal protein L11 methyltransferase [Candidatus Omnitrophota bacterium]
MMTESVSRPPANLSEFSIIARNASRQVKDQIQRFFEDAGIPSAGLVLWNYKKYFRVSAYALTTKQRQRITKAAKCSRLRGLCVQGKCLRPKDWFYKWQESYRKISVGKKFLIVPAWEKIGKTGGKRIPVVLDPRSAFGTGGHETTRLMIRMMESLEGKFTRFLDVGTGSGVLSVIASRLGAEEIHGFDYDAMSARIARENFVRNGCQGGRFFRANLGKVSGTGRFDLVGANMLSKTLLRYRKKLASLTCPGGFLVVSGISKRHFPDFRKQFPTDHLRLIRVLNGRSWSAALYRRNQNRPSYRG